MLTPDLFGEPQFPEGFRYAPDVLSTADERLLVRRFEDLALQAFEFRGYSANRRIYTFGHKYVFAGQKPRADSSIPDYLRPLTEIAAHITGKPTEAFEQVMVTQYPPGAGIGWHRDRPVYEDIVGISFLAPCHLRLRQRQSDGSWVRRAAPIEPRSAYLLSREVRDEWQHSIAAMDEPRYSVTLRTFRPGKGAEAPAAGT
ncbi:alpha-ketoglutarate-dependent dioxygenase AlkB [Caenimonas soli]|uniref:alpha-ketoglutarate-dependent dioxygenase AlkB n=1 Tax=Caenimonas soli TaxID=2735555 RepID=UPI0015576AEA|nr:alpha-ketoglutarate-dependent dioxygenase AlkB [Caenimonas soli]NPC58500.1 alpha-ketoglutarate-dependent dioxygenase AlkB [Caenimonas soli]